MVSYLFPNFLRNAGEYDQAARFWQEQWDDLISRLGESELWQTPWLGTTFANGSASRDGNPIFSAVSHSRRLGIRIIQVEPQENPREIAFWTDRFDDGEDAIDELVIACVLTHQTLTDALDIMTQWITTREVEVLLAKRTSTGTTFSQRYEIGGPIVAAPSRRRPALVYA